MIADLMTRACTIVKVGDAAPDRRNDPTEDPVEHDTVCELQQIVGQGLDYNTQGEVRQSTWRLYLPATEATLEWHDRVRVGGVEYEVIGPPSSVYGVGPTHHVEAIVRRTS